MSKELTFFRDPDRRVADVGIFRCEGAIRGEVKALGSGPVRISGRKIVPGTAGHRLALVNAPPARLRRILQSSPAAFAEVLSCPADKGRIRLHRYWHL